MTIENQHTKEAIECYKINCSGGKINHEKYPFPTKGQSKNVIVIVYNDGTTDVMCRHYDKELKLLREDDHGLHCGLHPVGAKCTYER